MRDRPRQAPERRRSAASRAADVDEIDHIKPSSAALFVPESAMNMPGMNDMPDGKRATAFQPEVTEWAHRLPANENDGKAMLMLLHSRKVYRLEAQPFLFSQNGGRWVYVTGHFGSVLTVEDPHVPSYVVETVDAILPNCSSQITFADIKKALAPPEAPIGGS